MDTVVEVVQRLNAAWPAGRTEELREVFDPDVVLLHPGPGPERRLVGREAVIASYREFFDQAVIHSFEMDPPRVDAFGSAAVASCPYTIEYEIGGRRWVGSGRDLLVLREGSSGWKVVWRTVLSVDEKEVP